MTLSLSPSGEVMADAVAMSSSLAAGAGAGSPIAGAGVVVVVDAEGYPGHLLVVGSATW